MKRRLFLAAGAALVIPGLSRAADANQPHPHQGVLPKFTGNPPVPALSESDLATLAQGKAVMKQVKSDTGGRGTAFQDVNATPEKIWGKITNLAMYPTWVDGVSLCEVYKTSGSEIDARFIIGAMGMKVEYFVKHSYHPDLGYMTWTLDYSRLSDLDDSVGFWHVEALADKPGWSRVVYSVQVKLNGWVPGFIEDMLANSGLTKATAWVKRESEKA